MHQTIDIPVEHWPVHCRCCGTDHDEYAWEKLEHVGVQRSGMDDYPDLEMRSCNSCGSTISVVVSQDFE